MKTEKVSLRISFIKIEKWACVFWYKMSNILMKHGAICSLLRKIYQENTETQKIPGANGELLYDKDGILNHLKIKDIK